jgi:hypothetical protein
MPETLKGTVPLKPTWTPIPGTYFEVRGVSARVRDLDYQISFGFKTDILGAVDLRLTSYERPLVDVTVLPSDRSAGDPVADVWVLGIGMVTVRWAFATPLPPLKPKASVWTGSQFHDESLGGFFGDKPWSEAPGLDLPALPAPKYSYTAPAYGEGEVYDGDLPGWMSEALADGWTADEILELLEDSDRAKALPSKTVEDIDGEELTEEEWAESSPEAFQQYMSRRISEEK